MRNYSETRVLLCQIVSKLGALNAKKQKNGEGGVKASLHLDGLRLMCVNLALC